jgi:hypothetical protein
MPQIPVLTPQDADFLLKYFSGVATAIAKRFELGFHPDEEHLTSLLCELLDDKGALLHKLSYTVQNLNKDLENIGSLLRASLSLETTKYSKYQEKNLTQADLGIILDYRDHVDYSKSFRRALLVQAKKLFPANGSGYALSSCYKSFNSDQHGRILRLRDYYSQRQLEIDHGKEMLEELRHQGMLKGIACYNSFQYLLYNPAFALLPRHDQEEILHHQLSRETSCIFDYTHGLCLYNLLMKRNGLKDTLDISSMFIDIDTAHSLAEEAARSGRAKSKLTPFDLRSVVRTVDIRERSFAWYIVFNFILGNVGCDFPDFIKLVGGSPSDMARELGISPPRFVLHVTLTAGTHPEKNYRES